MKDPPISILWERYLAVDLHKHYLVISGVNALQEIVLGPRRLDLAAWPRWDQTPARVAGGSAPVTTRPARRGLSAFASDKPRSPDPR